MSMRCIQKSEHQIELNKQLIKQILGEDKKNKQEIQGLRDDYISSKEKNIYTLYSAPERKSQLSEEEKLRNREKIDFTNAAISFDCIKKIFTMADGSKIALEDTATKPRKGTVKEFEVVNNNLIMKKGCYYNYTDRDGYTLMFSAGNSLYNDSTVDDCRIGGRGMENKTKEWYHSKARKTADIITSMLELKVPYAAYMSYSHQEVAELLHDVGISAGKFTLGIDGGYSNNYYMTHNGEIYAEYEVESRREAINMTNYLELSAPPGTMYLIDGVKYKMDEKGYFHIPENTMVCPGEMQLIDENGKKVKIYI